jgi:SH3-like domain-containing protein
MTPEEREARRKAVEQEYDEARRVAERVAEAEHEAALNKNRSAAAAAQERRRAALAELVDPEEQRAMLTARVAAYLIDHCREAVNEYWADADATKLGAAFEKARAEFDRKLKDSDGRP